MILYDNFYTLTKNKQLENIFTVETTKYNPHTKRNEKYVEKLYNMIPNPFKYDTIMLNKLPKDIRDVVRKSKYIYQFPKTAINYVEKYYDLTTDSDLKTYKFEQQYELYDYQEKIIGEVLTNLANGIKNGVIVSPVGSGKTLVAIDLIQRFKKTILVIVPSRVLLYQWIEMLQNYLKIPEYEIGKLGDGSKEIKPLTIGVFKTVEKMLDKIKHYFSLIVIDEVHKCPTNTYLNILTHTTQRYTYGFTATYDRKDRKEYLIKAFVSPIKIINTETKTLKPCVYIIQTGIKVPFVRYVDMLSQLATNTRLNEIIADIVKKASQFSGKQLIVTARKSQVAELKKLLPNAKVITGDTTDRTIDKDIIISTNVLNEGFDLKDLGIIHIVYPNNNIPKLEQLIGRIVRYHKTKDCIIFDYWFTGRCKGFSIEKSQETRFKYYLSKGFKYKIVR